MSDKLINVKKVTSQVEFDEFGGYQLTEVLDHDVLEAVGGGVDVNIKPSLPSITINIPCRTTTTNNCPPPSPPTPPASGPTPTPPKKEEEKKKDEDGDGE